jgi:hypothetical protein
MPRFSRALARGADTVITGGAPSLHANQDVVLGRAPVAP